MTAICPDTALRRQVLQCMLDSIAFVDRAAPQAWGVTLFSKGFRFNVGLVEALTCGVFDDENRQKNSSAFELRLLTQGELPSEVLSTQQTEAAGVQVLPTPYASIPSPQHVVSFSIASAAKLSHWCEKLMEAHQRYLAAAIRTSTGSVRVGTVHRRTHSEGLIEYARTVCEATPVTSALRITDGTDHQPAEFFEGRPIAVQTTRYERSEGARRTCLAHHGYRCTVCGFDFGATYGAVAYRYIQVHHLNPLAEMGTSGVIDPINDMAPLCANCHAVAHFRSPPYTVEELRCFINKEHKS